MSGVENSIAYVQKNFLNGLQISSLEALKRAEDAALLARFLPLSPKAEAYYAALRQPPNTPLATGAAISSTFRNLSPVRAT
jgi:hypothetical protein